MGYIWTCVSGASRVENNTTDNTDNGSAGKKFD
jgi:hypothetical protein